MPTLVPEPILRVRTPLPFVAGIVALSVTASAFLFWLVYYHQPTDVAGTHLSFLPSLNALLNALCTVSLIVGYRYIRGGRPVAHRNAMLSAFVFSSLFLVSYITNHAMHGDQRFPLGHPTARFIYLWVLLTPHILASVLALPLVLVTFFLALTGKFALHRKAARYTFPLWLYVSVSGVVVYAMLAVYR